MKFLGQPAPASGLDSFSESHATHHPHLDGVGAPPVASKEESDHASAEKEGELQQRDGAGVSLLRGEGGREAEGGRVKETEGRFLTYWNEKGTDRPVKWVFFSGGIFEASSHDGRAGWKEGREAGGGSGGLGGSLRTLRPVFIVCTSRASFLLI